MQGGRNICCDGLILDGHMVVRALIFALTLLCAASTAHAQGSTHQKTLGPAPIVPQSPPPELAVTAKSVAPNAPVAVPVIVDASAVSSTPSRTRLAFDLTGLAEYQVFRLKTPDRVVVDLTNVDFALAPAAGRAGGGLVRSFRFGAFAPGKSRVVIEPTGPVKVEATRMLREGAHGRHRLEIELVPSSAVELSEIEVAAAVESVARLKAGDDESARAATPTERRIPTIVIDPGHGGVDTGAQGAAGAEKDIVLAVARELNRALLASGRYRVVMTRSSDVFMPIDRRLQVSRQHGAQLFISLHADSLEQRDLAGAIRGATIYSLAHRASDEQSRRLADKENAADLLSGAQLTSDDRDEVKSILFDLMARETDGLALNFRRIAAKHLRNRVNLSREPQRAANFAVLRQAETPAVLIELGYISHAEEERQMMSADWQRKISAAITNAIDDYFSGNKAIFR